jgi:hypothetical protein
VGGAGYVKSIPGEAINTVFRVCGVGLISGGITRLPQRRKTTQGIVKALDSFDQAVAGIGIGFGAELKLKGQEIMLGKTDSLTIGEFLSFNEDGLGQRYAFFVGNSAFLLLSPGGKPFPSTCDMVNRKHDVIE